MKKNIVIAMLILFSGNVAMADAVVGYANSYLRFVDDETSALGNFNPLGSGITLKCVAPLADGNFAAAYEADSTGENYLRIFDGTTMAAGNYSYFGTDDITHIAGLPNGDCVISYAGGILRLVDGETASPGSYIELGSGVTVNGLTALANGNVAAVYEGGGTNYARVFDGTTMAAGSYTSLGSENITHIAGLANGDFVISYGDGIVRLADGETAALGNYVELGAGVTVNGLTALADGNFAAAYGGGGGSYARIFDGTTAVAGDYAWLGSAEITNVVGLTNGDFLILYLDGSDTILRLVDGETSVPLDSFNYELTGETINCLAGDLIVSESTVTLLPGDANRDGVVSAGDYASVQSNFGNTGEPGIPGDANCDGVVSAGDYASVQSNFGNTAPAQAVPEPVTLCVLVVGGALISNRRR